MFYLRKLEKRSVSYKLYDMQVNSAIFVSDFHLTKEHRERYEKVTAFLGSLEGKIDHLFVLGDAFEFWYNDRKSLLDEYRAILKVFKRLSDTGTRLIFFEGNHDICYGEYFKNELHAQIFRKSQILRINDYTVFAGHGDELTGGNLKYLFWRTLLRLPPVKLIISRAPSRMVLKIALCCSRISRRMGCIKRIHINEAYKKFAIGKFDEGVDVVILGHTHIPEITEIGGGLYINCGNWIHNFSYVEYRDDKFTLKYHGKG